MFILEKKPKNNGVLIKYEISANIYTYACVSVHMFMPSAGYLVKQQVK